MYACVGMSIVVDLANRSKGLCLLDLLKCVVQYAYANSGRRFHRLAWHCYINNNSIMHISLGLRLKTNINKTVEKDGTTYAAIVFLTAL